MDSEKPEKIFDIDAYLGKAPEEEASSVEEPQTAPEGAEKTPEGQVGAEAIDVAEKTAEPPIDPVQLKYRRNRIIVALSLGCIALIAGIFIAIDLIDKHNFREQTKATYEQSLATLEDNEKAFNDAFTNFSYSVYGLSGAPAFNDIYPTEEQMTAANHNCLRHFGIDTGEFMMLSERNKEKDDYMAADDEIVRISNNFTKATSSLERCRQDILQPIASDFVVEYGDMTFEESAFGYRIVMTSKMTYVGSRKVSGVTLGFTIYDENGKSRATSGSIIKHTFGNEVNAYKNADFDPFKVKDANGGIARKNIDKSAKSMYEESKVGIYSISGKYQSADDF